MDPSPLVLATRSQVSQLQEGGAAISELGDRARCEESRRCRTRQRSDRVLSQVLRHPPPTIADSKDVRVLRRAPQYPGEHLQQPEVPLSVLLQTLRPLRPQDAHRYQNVVGRRGDSFYAATPHPGTTQGR